MSFAPFRVKVPGSSANLGPGFDSIGMALDCYLTLYFEPSESPKITVGGKHPDGLCPDEDNLIFRVIRDVYREQGVMMPPLDLHIENDIPVARGLGSSAAAIVAALVAANHMLKMNWSHKELLRRATLLEGHPDNVGASLFGGVVIGSWDGRKVEAVTCEPPDLPVMAIIPEQPLLTATARKALPDHYPKKDAVLTSSRANLLVAAFYLKKWDLLKTAMQDAFHQPYRETLIPGLKEGLSEATSHGAYGIALSGAGPTMVAFVNNWVELKRFFSQLFLDLKVPVKFEKMSPAKKGAIVELTVREKHSKFI